MIGCFATVYLNHANEPSDINDLSALNGLNEVTNYSITELLYIVLQCSNILNDIDHPNAEDGKRRIELVFFAKTLN